MKKRLLLLVILGVVLSFSCSVALGFDPLGPPAAGLRKGQYSAGAEYMYSRMDLKLNEGKWHSNPQSDSGTLPSGKIKNFEMNKVYARLGYGITDNWETFLRLGGANTDFKSDKFGVHAGRVRFDGDTDFAIGFGTKATFYEKGKLKFGGLFQMSWANTDAKASGTNWTETLEIDIREIQIAAGPTYKLMESVSIYGGPFFNFIDGDAEAKFRVPKGTTIRSYDIDEDHCFGGFIGAQVEVIKNLPFCIEWQHTADADALAISLVYSF